MIIKLFRKISQKTLIHPFIIKILKSAHIYPYIKSNSFDEDGLISIHNHDFTKSKKFISAYERGIKAHKSDIGWRWRVHVGLWAASYASKLEGDFVECGVNKGFLSSAIMNYIHWNTIHKKFYLFDTFCGIEKSLVSKEEIALGRIKESESTYSECYKEVKNNFEEYKNVILIRGSVPSTLRNIRIHKVCYLSIDMNNYKPEIAAVEFFWNKIVHGGIILLDDYAYFGYLPQKKAFDAFAHKKRVEILSLPTGQGVIIKT